MRRRLAPALVVFALALVACTSGNGDGGTPGSPSASPSPSPSATSRFCSRLQTLDAKLRVVRSWTDRTASVERYTRAIATLDVAFRRMRDLAPEGLDLSPIEYANGRFGEIVRAMPPGLAPKFARAQVAIQLESYATAIYQMLVAECGPESVGA
jgi:hypothetical protein